MTEEDLTKITINLPNHWATGGETMWAKFLGDDLYQIENVPFHAYGLNYLDIVRATPDSPESIPEIRELVKASGHRTLRLLFVKAIERDHQVNLLESLKKYQASYERADDINVAIDVKAEGDYNAVYDQLEEYIDKGFLSFETCEARVEGSFDDVFEEA